MSRGKKQHPLLTDRTSNLILADINKDEPKNLIPAIVPQEFEMGYEQFKELKGQVVEKIFISPGEHNLFLVCNNGNFLLSAEGDCCSESWWSDLTGVKKLIGGTIFGFSEVEYLDINDERTRQDSDSGYRFIVYTNNGETELDFICSSNGYYGGWVDLGITKEKPSKEYIEVLKDWRAS